MATEVSLAATWRTAKPRSLWGDAARTFARNRAGMFGLVIAILLFLAAIFAPLLAPYDHLEQNWSRLREPPSRDHIMGTDELGRDVYSRLLMGARTAILVAIIITFTATIIGLILGSLGAYLGGWVDQALVWVMDALMNFPSIWLAAFVSVSTRPSIARWAQAIYIATGWESMRNPVILDYLLVFGCLGLVGWPGVARLVRSQVLSIREREFIEAQRAIGAPTWWITSRHLMPNVLGSVIVSMSSSFGNAMLAESSLSFLGVGIQPPGASWGNMIASSLNSWRSDPHLILMPGLVLSVAVLAYNFIGDALNDALNPRERDR
ncbi:MAG: ABC transporter permease [Chloroflexi bacterium]|nr:ABC transporter permease [Chloroflexota bacterium]